MSVLAWPLLLLLATGPTPATAAAAAPDQDAAPRGASAEAEATAPAVADAVADLAARGDRLLADDRAADAAASYLAAWDAAQAEFTPKALTDVAGVLATLAAGDPEVAAQVDERRAAAEARLLAGEGWLPAAQLAALDRARGHDERTLTSWDRARGTLAPDDPGRRALFNHAIDPLLAARRYEDLVAGAGDVEGRVVTVLSGYARTAALLSAGVGDLERLAPLRERAVEEAASWYEALLGAGRAREADDLAAALLAFDDSLTTVTVLTARAVRAGDSEAVRRLELRAAP